MASIEVRDDNTEDNLFENVNRLMVDEGNRLFVIGDNNKQLAIYASGAWHSAVNVDPEPEAGPFDTVPLSGGVYVGHNPKPSPGPFSGPFSGSLRDF